VRLRTERAAVSPLWGPARPCAHQIGPCDAGHAPAERINCVARVCLELRNANLRMALSFRGWPGGGGRVCVWGVQCSSTALWCTLGASNASWYVFD
jgi:hypothetical protein